MRAAHACVMLAGAVLLTACRGEQRQQQSAARDTAAPSATSETTATAPPAETTTAAVAPDTSRKLPAVKESTAAPPKAGTSVARKSGARAKPTAPTAGDTTAKPSAPKPSQDTSKAAAQDTSKAKPAQPSETTQTAEAPLRDAYHQPPLDTVSQAVYNGWKQFNLNCARCHGEDVLGTTIAPHLILSLKPDGPINTKEIFMQTVCAGRPAKGMPAWCALGLDMQKISDIYSYVKGRSDGKIHPGRPAVREQG